MKNFSSLIPFWAIFDKSRRLVSLIESSALCAFWLDPERVGGLLCSAQIASWALEQSCPPTRSGSAIQRARRNALIFIFRFLKIIFFKF
jgi:hypothetical protein